MVSLRKIVSTLTFIGVMFHELGHQIFCIWTGIKVHKICYFRFGNPAGYVIHEKPQTFKQSFLITMGPFITGAFFAVIFFFLTKLNHLNEIYKLLFIWAGGSIAMNSFPSDVDAKSLWKDSNAQIKRNFFAFIGYPFAFIIWLLNSLTVLWIDVIYAVVLYLFIQKL